MRKTLSRAEIEERYAQLLAYNPFVAGLKFNRLLTEPLETLVDEINFITDMSVVRGGTTVPKELVRRNLQEINEYGHSLVLQYNDDDVKAGKDLSSVQDVLVGVDQQVVINTAHDMFVVVHRGVDKVTFGNKVHYCKAVQVFLENGDMMMYLVPLDKGTRRVFAASHCSLCRKCRECGESCIKACSGSKYQYADLETGELMDSLSELYDIHMQRCLTGKLCYKVLALIVTVLEKYEEEFITTSKKMTSVAGERTVSKPRAISVVREYDGKEHFISVKQYRAEKKEWLGGHHRSPVAHEVKGYWRRRSKKDSTLIWVEGFNRGGKNDTPRAKQIVKVV